MSILRVSTAQFKENPRPFVQRAKFGETVIITAYGADDFQIIPCTRAGAPPVLSGLVDRKAYEGVDLDEPAFEPLQ